MPKRFMRRPEVLSRVGIGKSKLYELMATSGPERFPQAVKLGTVSAWIESEVNDWMDRQIAARPKAA